MQLSPSLMKFLGRLGVNTTRLQWKLYQLEKRRERNPNASRLPASLQWLQYRHKFCRQCGAVVDREARECPSCKARVPSMNIYRVLRALGLVTPESAAPTVSVFLVVMVGVYLLGFLRQGVTGLLMPSSDTLLTMGAWHPLPIYYAGEYWRMMSCGLVHIGLIHILFNGMALTQVGPLVEAQTGWRKMLVVITLTQFASAIASDIYYWQYLGYATLSAGASGWLFGLIGFGIGYFHYIGSAGRMYRGFLIQWAIYGILFGFIVSANNAAHIGGMIAGILLGLIPDQHPRTARLWNSVWGTAFWISAAVWLFVLGSMFLYMGHYWGESDILRRFYVPRAM